VKPPARPFFKNGVGYVRLTLGKDVRRALATPLISPDELEARRALCAEQTKRLRDAGHHEEATKLIPLLASKDAANVKAVLGAIELLCAGRTEAKCEKPTLRKLAHRWTSGELAR
jgi:hypothetical protein